MKHYLIGLVQALAQTYFILILIHAFSAWLRQDIIYRIRPFLVFVATLVDPFLKIIRQYFPVVFRGFDMSPVIGIILLEFMKYIIIALINAAFGV